MRLTKSERETIIRLANQKLSDKAKKEIEEIKAGNPEYPDYIIEADELNKEAYNLERKIKALQDKYTALTKGHNSSVLSTTGSYYFSNELHNFKAKYIESEYRKAHPDPNIEDMINLELLKGAFDVESFLKKFE